MKVKSVCLFFFLVVFAPLPAMAERIPPHMAKMAARLYQGLSGEATDNQLLPERGKVRDEALETLRKMKIQQWSTKPVKIKHAATGIAKKLGLDPRKSADHARLKAFMETRGRHDTTAALNKFMTTAKRKLSATKMKRLTAEIDAAFGKNFASLETDYTEKTIDGRTVQMKWNPNTDRFFIKISGDGTGGFEEFVTIFAGDVETKLSDNGEDLDLDITSSNGPPRALTATDIEALRATILGEWQTEDDTVYRISASDERSGDIRPPREFFDKQIDKIKDKVKSIKETKIFKWLNPETGQFVRQETFRRLKDPFEYLGDGYALDDGEARIKALETEISALEFERDGGNLALKDKYDPAGFKKLSGAQGARAISIKVRRSDGYTYSYDEAVFDGRRISAKRTFTTLRDVDNLRLPNEVRRQIIKSWAPPGWLQMDASIDIQTGTIVLNGATWTLHVTYSSSLGGSPKVESIQTPYSNPLFLRRDGDNSNIAEGASKDFKL